MYPFFPEELGPSLSSFDGSHSQDWIVYILKQQEKGGLLFMGVAGSGSSFPKIILGAVCGIDSCGRPFRKLVLSP